MPRGRPASPIALNDEERNQLRLGRPRAHQDERVAEVINTVLQSAPPNATHWSVRSMAEHTGISKSTVQRWFDLFGVQPHRQKHFKLSNNPFFIEKMRDIVGLYLNPLDHAVVLCVDANSQIQALQRIQPMLPVGLGYVEGVTQDYVRTEQAEPHPIPRRQLEIPPGHELGISGSDRD